MQANKKRIGHCQKAVQSVDRSQCKFTSRIIHSNCKYNGNSVNWRHDWFKVCKRSYAEVVARKVNNVSRQVENYPCNSVTANTMSVNRIVKNRDPLKVMMVNTKQSQNVTGQPNKVKSQSSRPVHSKWGYKNLCKGNSSKNKVNDNIDTNTHLEKGMKAFCTDKSHSLCTDQFTSIENGNRFWPLIGCSDTNESEVVIHGFDNGKKLNIDTHQKDGIDQCKGHDSKAKDGRSHTNMVGGDLGHIAKNVPLNDGVVPRRNDVAMVMQDKYDLALKFKAKHKNKLDKANNSNILKTGITKR